MGCAAAGDDGQDPAGPHPFAVDVVVVAAVGEQRVGLASGTADSAVELPEEAADDTVPGLIIDRRGRSPAIGDSAVIDVQTRDGHVPSGIRIEKKAEKTEGRA